MSSEQGHIQPEIRALSRNLHKHKWTQWSLQCFLFTFWLFMKLRIIISAIFRIFIYNFSFFMTFPYRNSSEKNAYWYLFLYEIYKAYFLTCNYCPSSFWISTKITFASTLDLESFWRPKSTLSHSEGALFMTSSLFPLIFSL